MSELTTTAAVERPWYQRWSDAAVRKAQAAYAEAEDMVAEAEQAVSEKAAELRASAEEELAQVQTVLGDQARRAIEWATTPSTSIEAPDEPVAEVATACSGKPVDWSQVLSSNNRCQDRSATPAGPMAASLSPDADLCVDYSGATYFRYVTATASAPTANTNQEFVEQWRAVIVDENITIPAEWLDDPNLYQKIVPYIDAAPYLSALPSSNDALAIELRAVNPKDLASRQTGDAGGVPTQLRTYRVSVPRYVERLSRAKTDAMSYLFDISIYDPAKRHDEQDAVAEISPADREWGFGGMLNEQLKVLADLVGATNPQYIEFSKQVLQLRQDFYVIQHDDAKSLSNVPNDSDDTFIDSPRDIQADRYAQLAKKTLDLWTKIGVLIDQLQNPQPTFTDMLIDPQEMESGETKRFAVTLVGVAQGTAVNYSKTAGRFGDLISPDAQGISYVTLTAPQVTQETFITLTAEVSGVSRTVIITVHPKATKPAAPESEAPPRAVTPTPAATLTGINLSPLKMKSGETRDFTVTPVGVAFDRTAQFTVNGGASVVGTPTINGSGVATVTIKAPTVTTNTTIALAVAFGGVTVRRNITVEAAAAAVISAPREKDACEINIRRGTFADEETYQTALGECRGDCLATNPDGSYVKGPEAQRICIAGKQ